MHSTDAPRAGRRTRWIPILLALLAIAPAVGCAGDRPPVVTVVRADLVETTDEAIRLDVALQLDNPNAGPLELREIEYGFAVDGRRVYSGRRAAQATLSSFGSKELVLPAVVPFARVGWTASDRPDEVAWSIDGSILYLAPGALAEILLDISVRRPEVAFRGSGRAVLR